MIPPHSILMYSFLFCLVLRLPPRSTLFPYTTLFRSALTLACTYTREVALHFWFWNPNAERVTPSAAASRSEEHTSELQSPMYLVCRLLLEKKKNHHGYPLKRGAKDKRRR